MQPVQDVALRDPADWRLLGKPMQRLDIVAKSTGTLTYGIDLEIPDMVHATVCLNPSKGGPLLGFDRAAVEAVRGDDIFSRCHQREWDQ